MNEIPRPAPARLHPALFMITEDRADQSGPNPP
jgi:hypothetical protein